MTPPTGRTADQGPLSGVSPPARRETGRPRSAWIPLLVALLVAAPLPTLLWAGNFGHAVAPSGARSGTLDPLETAALGISNSPVFGPESLISDVTMAYDAQAGILIAVAEDQSGATGLQQPLQTWAYTSGQWTELRPSTSPSGRIGASLVYDPSLRSLVLFGGLGPEGYLADTWTYANDSWTNVTASQGAAPAARASASFVWDSDDGVAVLFGGIGANGTSWANATTGRTATWLLGAHGWSAVTQASGTVPSPLGSLADDPADGYVVDFGGSTGLSPCSTYPATWQFLRGTWRNITINVTGSPPARWSASAGYDESTSSVVLFGGSDCLSYRNDTWTYSRDHWTQVPSPSAPTPRAGSLLAFDGTDASLVLFGGTDLNGPRADTWALGPRGWSQQGPVLEVTGGLLQDSITSTDIGQPITLTLVGILPVGSSTFTFSGLPQACSSGNSASFACTLTQAGTFRVTGGITSSAGSASFPEIAISVVRAPTFASIQLSATATEVGVPVTIRAVVVGGTGNYTYSYGGLPSGCASVDAPLLVCTPVAEGAFQITISATDAVGGMIATEEPLVVGPHPYLQTVNASRSTIDVGLATQLSVVAGGGTGPLTFTYAGLPIGCVSTNTTGLVCAPSVSGTFTVRVTVTDSYGYAASGGVTFSVHPRLTIPSFSVNSTSATLDSNVSFSLSVVGGTAPYRVNYTGLPVGCGSGNVTVFTCAPRATGRFVVTASVVDALGEIVSQNVSIVVAVARSSGPIGGPGSGTPGAGGPSETFWEALAASLGSAVTALLVGLGLFVRRERRFAREGEALVAQMIDEAPVLGAEFGPLDDPARYR